MLSCDLLGPVVPPATDNTPAPTPSASESPNPPPQTSQTTPPEPTKEPEPTPTSNTPVQPPESTPPPNNSPTTTPPAPDESVPPTNEDKTSVIVTIVTRSGTGTLPGTSSTPTSSDGAQPAGSNGGSGGLSNSGKIAIAVVVPVVAVALFLVAAIWFWKRRKARKDAEEERRKEVEDYAYNPNADPTIPAVGLVSDGPYEMREDTTSGYRGWGSTATPGSNGPKAPTTLSGSGGGYTGVAYSDATSPPYAHVSDTRSGEPLVDGNPARDGSYSPEGEILGAMGPSAAANRGGDIHRGPSNASSSYSAGARSDGSVDGAMGGAYPNQYYDQYGSGNPYANDMYAGQRPADAPVQPVIRDNPARRNTRIESPSHYPQQSAGISQNF